MELLFDPSAWLAFFTLTALELVLGIDNIIFISILVERLPKQQQRSARRVGLVMAMGMRLGLLLLLSWIFGLTQTLFVLLAQDISGRDFILITGGMFLLWKSTKEIHHLLEGGGDDNRNVVHASFLSVILQIMVIDLVFSLDSIITAVGMVDEVEVMMAAVIASVALMLLFAEAISRIVSSHPTIKVLALAFLMVVGVVLMADGLDTHIPKGYVYFAMAFSVAVEAINLRMRRKNEPVQLHQHFERERPAAGSVLLYVRNLAAVAEFYQQVLGVQPLQADAEHARFEHGGLQLTLHRASNPDGQQDAAIVQRREQSPYRLCFAVDSLARAELAAQAAGGQLDAVPPAWAQGHSLRLGHDPEGNVIELREV